MPLYLFNLRDGDMVIEDTEGADLSTLQEAYNEAMIAARQLVAEMNASCVPVDDHFVEVCNHQGDVLVSIPLKGLKTLN